MGSLSGTKAVPAFYAAGYYLGDTGITVLMLALFAVILTSLIGNLLALSRLLYAAGREGEASENLAHLNGKGILYQAIFAIAAISVNTAKNGPADIVFRNDLLEIKRHREKKRLLDITVWINGLC